MTTRSALYTLADTTTFDLGTIDAVQSVTDKLFLVVVNGHPVHVQDPDGTQRKALCWVWSCWRMNHTREGSLC
jgi:hypothetical protein